MSKTGTIFLSDAVVDGGPQKVSAERVQSDIQYWASTESGQLLLQNDNIRVSSLLAQALYAEPSVVLEISQYWLSQYANGQLRAEHWVSDCLSKLMQHPVRLHLESCGGMSQYFAEMPRYALMLRFAGSDLHRVPKEFFALSENPSRDFLVAMAYVMEPSHDCFLVKNANGLRNELEFTEFRYDGVLNFFYEPSFFVLSLYLLLVQLVYAQEMTRRQEPQELLLLDDTDIVVTEEQQKNLQSLLQPVLALVAPRNRSDLCVWRGNTNSRERLEQYHNDLDQLHTVLQSYAQKADIARLLSQIKQQWQQKASAMQTLCAERSVQLQRQMYCPPQH
jgi:hypothetical protein